MSLRVQNLVMAPAVEDLVPVSKSSLNGGQLAFSLVSAGRVSAPDWA